MKEGDNFKILGETTQYVKDLVTNMNNSPNYIKIPAMQFMGRIEVDSIIDFTLDSLNIYVNFNKTCCILYI